MRMRWLMLAVVMVAVTVSGCRREPEGEVFDARQAFFERLSALCGQSFEGRGVFSATENDPMLQERMVMHVETCTENELRIPFHVGENRSRTWVLTRKDGGLLLKHDHRHPDGTPEDLTMYGGWATAEGTSLRQNFPADEQTAQMLPAAATNVWTLELEEGRKFVYDLKRHDQPRFRAEFDLSRPAADAPGGGEATAPQ